MWQKRRKEADSEGRIKVMKKGMRGRKRLNE